MTTLSRIIRTIKEKCVGCHRCISVCPVKFANEAHGDSVTINHDRCIGCGQCIHACEHKARVGVDDFDAFISDASRGVRMIAVVAPAIAANFSETYLNLNGWLASLGVEAVFDVSFGAELTVKSYVEHIKNDSPECVISQPCPAIVSYCQIYQPELLSYLAPVDSPMLHIMRMIRKYRPEYRGCKIAVISPCLAKKREFDETGFGDYNVTFTSIRDYLRTNGIRLESYPRRDYDNPPAERAVLFSTPGGLMRTAERFVPGIASKIRKIERPELIYKYLEQLPETIRDGRAPLIVDCLNCEAGCNGGTGTTAHHRPLDELETSVERRNEEMRSFYDDSEKRWWRSQKAAAKKGRKKLDRYIDEHWEPGLYDRDYIDHSANARIPAIREADRAPILQSMNKNGVDDMYNCSACGYNSCEKMIQAIHMGYNQPENCHYFLLSKAREGRANIEKIQDAAGNANTAATASSEAMEGMATSMEEINQFTDKIAAVLKSIEEIAFQTNLLALNAAVEAARAGESGKGFAVVADEVRNLSQRSAGAARETRDMVEGTLSSVRKGVENSGSLKGTFWQLDNAVNEIVQLADEMRKADGANGNGNGNGHNGGRHGQALLPLMQDKRK